MQPIQLTGIDQPLAPVVLGTMTFGDSADQRAAGEMIEDFLAAGGNGIDTANGYAGGRSESMLADLLRGRRDQVVLATKVGIPHPDAAGAAAAVHRRDPPLRHRQPAPAGHRPRRPAVPAPARPVHPDRADPGGGPRTAGPAA